MNTKNSKHPHKQKKTRRNPKRSYCVISPSWHDYSWFEPTEPACDFTIVQAHTKREAKILAVKEMTDWPRRARLDGINPFSGLKVELGECMHSVDFMNHCTKCEIEDECPNS